MTDIELKRHFVYDENTGNFYRKTSPTKISGWITNQGYIRISIGTKMYMAHRMAWLYMYGELPSDSIDHINGIKNDNRITNLRQITVADNNTNKIGLGYYKCGDKFRAQIVVDGKKIRLGSFDTEEQARQMYLNAKELYHPLCKNRL